jgi:eukaryotic translation initiation factor 2C
MYMRYREVMEKKAGGSAAPKRIIFYRGSSLFPHVYIGFRLIFFVVDGVSEGQFKQVLELGAPFLQCLLPQLMTIPF